VLEVEIRWPHPAALAGLIAPVVLSAHGNGRDLAEHHRWAARFAGRLEAWGAALLFGAF
jgi:hypothetical protein